MVINLKQGSIQIVFKHLAQILILCYIEYEEDTIAICILIQKENWAICSIYVGISLKECS